MSVKFKEYRLFLGIGLVFAALMAGVYLGSRQSHPVVVTRHNAPTVQTLPEVTEPKYPINVNTADAEILDHLPGIGPELAGAIVAFREENGPFLTVSDLLNVSGIGPAKLENLLPYITLGG